MTEQKIVDFFISNGFRLENGVFLGTNGYAFLPFNKSLIVGKNYKRGLLVEGMFKDSWIRSMRFDKKDGVLIDVIDRCASKTPSETLEGE